MISGIEIRNVGGLKLFAKGFASPCACVLEGRGKTSLFSALSALQRIARRTTQVGQLFPPLQYIPSSPIPSVVIGVEMLAFGRTFSYGIEVVYDPAQNSFLLMRETLVESSAGAIVYRLDRNATSFTETRYGRTSLPFAALFGTFLLATSNGLPADHPISLVRNELANQFLLSPLPVAMTGLIGQPTALSPDCANFASWLVFFLGRQSDYYAAYVETLFRMGFGQVVLNAQTGTGGARTLMVKFGYHAVPLVFTALSRCEKLICLAAAISTFNRMIPGVVLFPEDELTSLVAQGFVEDPHVDERACWVHHNFGKGWSSVVDGADDFDLGRFPDSHLVLIIDYDRYGRNRLDEIRRRLASNPYRDRIYVLGAAHEADDLKRQVAELSHRYSVTPKAVGSALAMSSAGSETCTDGLWGISQLAHNLEELSRLCHAARDVIFKS